MPKNIVVMIDGTGNEIAADETNVLRLARHLRNGAGQQVSYYDPGVGTQGAPAADLLGRRELVKVLGLGVGLGVYDKLASAYRFVVDHHQEGDRLFLFGFSRGAYVARALAGLIGKMGVLERGRDNLVTYAIKLYAEPRNLDLAKAFTAAFCDRSPDVHFLGLWDTVKSVYRLELRGGPQLSGVVLPRTFENAAVRTVRHALALDERRRFFRTNRWHEGSDAPSDVKQVWFAGVHCDVGGGYPAAEGGLAIISLKWMSEEARACGLHMSEDIIGGRSGEVGRPGPQPDFLGPLHRSLGGWWRLAEIVPKRARKGPEGSRRSSVYLPLGEPRFVPENALIHSSVLERMTAGIGYLPKNLPSTYRVET